jgi:outer membrane protein TolC
VDTFPKPDSKYRWVIGARLALVAALGSFAQTALAEPQIPFAEDIFPELKALMESAATGATELQVGELRIEERQGDLDVARALRRPRANLFARLVGSYETRDDIEDVFRGNVNANLTVTQPVYQWGNLKRQLAIAEQRVDLESIQLEQSGAQQFMELRKAYLQWLLSRQKREILRQSIELSETFVQARRQLVDVGQSSEQDVLEMEARLLENHEVLAWTEKSIVDLENVLERFAGPGFRSKDLTLESLSAIEPMSNAAFEELARIIRSRENFRDPVEERFSLLEEIEEQQLDSLDKRNWPTFDFVAGIFSDRLDAVNQDDSVIRVQYYAGVQVNWNLFDSWQTDGYKRSALARQRAFSLFRDKAESDARRKSETLLAGLQLNLKQIEARSKRENLLERRVALLREQAERNLITGTERIEGEIDYLEVRQRLMEARVNYLVNLMELGILLDQDPAAIYYTSES